MKKDGSYFITYEQFIDGVSPDLRGEAERMYVQSSFRRVFISGIVFLFIAVVSLSRDIIVGFYLRANEPLNFLNLIALVILICGSVSTVLLGIRDMKKPLSMRLYTLWHLVFYFVINISMFLLVFNEFYRGFYTAYEEFYWLFFSAVPLLHLRSSILNVAVIAVVFACEYACVMSINGIPFYHFTYFLPVLFAFSFFGLYLRRYYMNNIIFTLQNRQLTEQYRTRSCFDPLTGCYNRYVLNERFEALRITCHKLAVIMLDIDNFKGYNDGFSHLKGDECLVSISGMLSKLCTENGADLFRYGGEEFVVFVPNADNDVSQKLALSIVESARDLRLSMPDEFGSIQPFVTVSVGLALFPLDETSKLKGVISEADRQLYLAKAAGKNCVVYKNSKLQ